MEKPSHLSWSYNYETSLTIRPPKWDKGGIIIKIISYQHILEEDRLSILFFFLIADKS